MFYNVPALLWAVGGTAVILDDEVSPFLYGTAVAGLVVNLLYEGAKK